MSDRNRLASLEATLKRDPTNAAASQVWADALVDAGDARGEIALLEHAILAADPERALVLAAEQAAIWDKHRAAIHGKSGGFPFRERWCGREAIFFGSSADDRIGRGSADAIFMRMQRFMATTTDAYGPVSVRFAGPPLFGDRTSRPRTPTEYDLLHALAPAHFAEVPGATLVMRERIDVPLVDESMLRALVGEPRLALVYQFRFTRPGSRVLLPHQTRPSTIEITLMSRRVSTELYFPFEVFSDPGFLRLHEAVVDDLGIALPRGRFTMRMEDVSGMNLESAPLRELWR